LTILTTNFSLQLEHISTSVVVAMILIKVLEAVVNENGWLHVPRCGEVEKARLFGIEIVSDATPTGRVVCIVRRVVKIVHYLFLYRILLNLINLPTCIR
jgi:hypothetical protein